MTALPPLALAAAPVSPETRAVLARIEAGELVTAAEFALVLRVGHSQFHRLEHAGALEVFKVFPPIGIKRFSGVLIGRYLRGEPLEAPVFGRRRRASGKGGGFGGV